MYSSVVAERALPGRRIKPLRTNIAFPMNGKKKSPVKAHSTNVLDYPCTMSSFERESLAAEAKIKAEREKQKQGNHSAKRKEA